MYFAYSKNHPIVLLLTPIIVIGYLLALAFVLPHNQLIEVDLGWFGNYQMSYWVSLALNALTICVNSILINWVFNRFEFYDRNTYVPSLVYISLISFFDSTLNFNGATLAQTFLLFALFTIYSLNQQDDGRKKAYNIGFFTSIAICLVPTYFPLGIFSFIMLWTFRPIIGKEFLLMIAGLLTPLVYMFYISLYQQQIHLQDTYIQLNENIYLTVEKYLPIAVSAVGLLFAFAGFRSRLQKATVRHRRLFRVQYLLILLGVFYLGVDLMFNGQFQTSVLIIIPLTLGLSLAATNNKLNRFTLPLLYIILLLTFYKFFGV